MKLNFNKIEEEIDSFCIKAVIPYTNQIHNEIQKTLNKIHKFYPIEKVLMGNGGYFIEGGIVEYFEDDEYCKFKIQDLSIDGQQKSNYWNYLDPKIYQDVEYLFELLDFLINGCRYFSIKDFTPY